MTIVRRLRPASFRRRAIATASFMALAAFPGATPCQAQIVMQVENSTAAPGSTSAFNVVHRHRWDVPDRRVCP